jgi:hypothetical protein
MLAKIRCMILLVLVKDEPLATCELGLDLIHCQRHPHNTDLGAERLLV